jgi:hypothetical protein
MAFWKTKKCGKNMLIFLQKAIALISIDLLGHGESDSLGYVHSMEENANAVQEVLISFKY